MPEGQPEGFHIRFPEEVRWTGVLQTELGDDYVVVEEGLNGRTTCFDQPGFRCRNGQMFFESNLLTHEPVDVVVIMLGSNDLKDSICGDPHQSADGIGKLVEQASTTLVGPEGAAPNILLIAPPHFGAGILSGPFSAEYSGQKTIDASKQLAPLYEKQAEAYGAAFMDAADHAETGRDGLHMSEESHGRLGLAVADKIRSMIG